jgi:glucose uptake protein GlcU
MLAPVLMSSKHFIIRKFKDAYDPFTQTIDGFIIEYTIFSLFAIYLGIHGEPDLSARNLIIGTIAGLFYSVSRINMSMAVAIGIAGPAQAMISTHALYQTMWSAVLDGQAVSFW